MVMRVTVFGAVVSTAIALSTGAHGATGEGAGIRTCDSFLRDYSDNPSLTEEHYFAWAQGFMSAGNIGRPDDVDGGFRSMSMDAQKAHILEYCEAHPAKKYLNAAQDLYAILYPKQR